MAGNVLEWTSSLYRRYPHRPDDGREDPYSDGDHTLHSGAFNNGAERCAAPAGTGTILTPRATTTRCGWCPPAVETLQRIRGRSGFGLPVEREAVFSRIEIR
ncbi:hypothetical protein [Caldilinea sp.]|uniref:hypothetical protein n=1 Tax=Caldilinea sp. TaxID=2293560 RepID=UPI0031CCD66E